MLRYLSVSNLAVVNRLQLEFRRGLNILSGETGSGKSIIIDAVGLILGEKASPDIIRTGENKAVVEGVFGIEANAPLIEILTKSGIDVDTEEVVIRREVQFSGRGRIFVNNQSATLSLLKQIQPHLIDIHGQGDQQSLLMPDAHMRHFDAFVDAEKLRQEIEKSYLELDEIVRDLDSLSKTEAEKLQVIDILKFQIAEIEAASLKFNEDTELLAERQLLVNAEKLVSLCLESYGLLYDYENSVFTQLGILQRRLSEASGVDPQFNSYLENIISAKYSLEDISFFLRDYIDRINISPERLRVLDDRLIEIEKLKRKYAGNIPEILAKLQCLKSESENLGLSEERKLLLVKKLTKLLEVYEDKAEILSRLRQVKAKKFERVALEEMKAVALESSRFSVRLNKITDNSLSHKISMYLGDRAGPEPFGNFGYECIEFYFSANKGEDLKPINAVASGGELSRLMLVLKNITSPTRFPRTLIFDEIDAGIGGGVAEAVGQRLRRLAESNQVLCVTHQAQIARYADSHFLVSKYLNAERMITTVNELANNERVDELARMIGGREITPVARKHARELLKLRA